MYMYMAYVHKMYTTNNLQCSCLQVLWAVVNLGKVQAKIPKMNRQACCKECCIAANYSKLAFTATVHQI